MKIDTHHHFWRYNTDEFGWIDDSMQRIRQDFLPSDLEQELRKVGIDGVVSVQARQSVEETNWLLLLAEEHDFIKGVVGWVPLADPNVRAYLEVLSGNKKLKAIRHVVQAEPDDAFLLRDDFNAGVAALAEFDLVYDILVFERHLSHVIKFVDRHPEQKFVLDHIAKPRIKENLINDWAAQMCQLGRRENVFCKVSGMVTEADYQSWSVEQLKPYWDMVLAAFGSRRLMFGSDWPVCLVACEYERWHNTVAELAKYLSADEQAKLFGETACEVYGLED
jgi:L-fuconolactonase